MTKGIQQKITPFLWFDKNAEEAMKFYVDVFSGKGKGAKIINIQRYPEGYSEGPMAGMEGKVLTGIFELAGQRFMALDGGPIFKFNPSISFHVKCKTKDEVDAMWEKLSKGGKVLMELGEYPWSEKYGWLQDKYGPSWQLIYVGESEINKFVSDEIKQKITPVLMFVGNVCGKAEEAVNFYASVFSARPGRDLASGGHKAKVQHIQRYGKGEKPDKVGTVKYAAFALVGQEFGAMDSAHKYNFAFNEAISFYVECVDQEEVDYFWGNFSAVPESEQCGWLKDKFGLSWQIIPKQLGELLTDPDKEKAGRVMDAMLKMKKIVVVDLEKAHKGQ